MSAADVAALHNDGTLSALLSSEQQKALDIVDELGTIFGRAAPTPAQRHLIDLCHEALGLSGRQKRRDLMIFRANAFVEEAVDAVRGGTRSPSRAARTLLDQLERLGIDLLGYWDTQVPACSALLTSCGPGRGRRGSVRSTVSVLARLIFTAKVRGFEARDLDQLRQKLEANVRRGG